MRFTDLLENYIILKDNDKELYYDIKDKWLYEYDKRVLILQVNNKR